MSHEVGFLLLTVAPLTSSGTTEDMHIVLSVEEFHLVF